MSTIFVLKGMLDYMGEVLVQKGNWFRKYVRTLGEELLGVKILKNKIWNRILCSMCKIPNFVLASWVVFVFQISGCWLSSTWGLARVLVQIFCCVSIWEFYVSLLCRCCFVLTNEILSFIPPTSPPPPNTHTRKRRKKKSYYIQSA